MATGMFLRSFEESNATKKHMVEQWVLSNINSSQLNERLPVNFYRNISFYLTEMPDIAQLPPDLKVRVLAVLVDGDMMEDLERAGLINWCCNVRTTLPINVPRDGNCLLHSMGTAVWAVHDSTLMLRRLLSLALSVDPGQRFYGRWIQYRSSQLAQADERLQESGSEELEAEWSEISQCLDADYLRSPAVPHRFLEAIHVYTLANVFRRPIIVMTDPTVRTFSGLSLQDNDMGGIYLPLEWGWGDTSHTPVLLGFSHNHFSPLLFGEHPNQALAGDSQGKNLIPLVNARFEQLPVRFLFKGEEPEVWALLSKYLKVKETVMQVNGTVQNILCAELESCKLPSELNLVNDYFQHCFRQYGLERSVAPDMQHQRTLFETASPSRQVAREQLQRLPTHEFSLADPSLQETGTWGQQQICIPAPSFTPHVSFLQQYASLNPPHEKKCVVPTCKFYGDPDLGMMCSNCFKKYTIKESRNRNIAAIALPTAPLPSFQAEGFQMSMMSERCQEGCGFRCSTYTYPYCHECADKRRKQAQEQTSKANVSSCLQTSSAGGANNLVFLPPSTLSKTGLEAAGVTQMNDLHQMHCTVSASPAPSATAAGGTSFTRQESGSGPVGAISTRPGEAKLADMSPTQIFTAGEQSALLTPTGDVSEALMFGSGVLSPLSMSQAEHNTSQAGGQAQASVFFNQPSPIFTTTTQTTTTQQSHILTNMVKGNLQCNPLTVSPSADLLSSVANMTESQIAETVTGMSTEKAKSSCSSQGCSRAAVHRDLCAKCYVGEGLAGPPNPSLQRLKQANPFSLTSSAPASIGPVASNTQGIVQNRSQTPTAMNLPEQLPVFGNSKNDLVQNWLENKSSTLPVTGRERAMSRQISQPVGLPERPESEPLGNDLIESGPECGPVSPTMRCTECSNRVQGEGPLCQQCRHILRQYRQAHNKQRHLSSVQETSPNQQTCLAEGCRYAGSAQCLGYCSVCYARLFKRQLEEETHQTHPANTSNALLYSRPAAPPSDFTVPVSGTSAHGQHCVVQGCTRFGDPKQKWMCGKHHQEHMATFQTAASKKRSQSAPIASRPEVNISIPTASQIRVTPYATTIYAPPVHAQVMSGEEAGESPAYGQGEPSISSPSFQLASAGAGRAQELSLGETFNRVALRDSTKCLNPDCDNFANRSKGGYCNSCSDGARCREQRLNRIILGEEQIG